MKNLFLTGAIGVGKSTLLKKVLEKLYNSIGGFKTEGLLRDNKKTYQMISLYDGSYGYEIGTIKITNENKQKYTTVFDDIGVQIIQNSLIDREVIVMDELGVIEADALIFQKVVKECLDSEKIVLGVLKKHKNSFLDYIKNREDTIVIEVTKENRESLEEYIIHILIGWNVRIKTKGISRWSKEKVRWYNEALNHPENKYPEAFIDEMKKDFKSFQGMKVLDIASGTGVFTFPLSDMGAEVTAVDSSFSGCESIRKQVIDKEIKNVKCITADWTTINVKEKYDISICAFCQDAVNSGALIKKLMNCTKYRIYIITYKHKEHKNFKVDELYPRLGRKKRIFSYDIKDMFNVFKDAQCLYDCKEVSVPFSQYFKNLEETRRFFYDHFNIKTKGEQEIIEEFLHENLGKYKNQIVFPNKRECLMVNIQLSN
ncbi:nucleoside-triphosphatase [Clostridium ganghwense]|uniref:Methyltransferase domain-containing protein n=1 Tax=Clostridium ganghwense TaxID=312089 RepID=A0ABT4CL57_9CLOT|nr:nucleoside-triphosphatase [Clostridium ganghwense]MCY6369785.1 methyltransferase domain-containing protein [Clostridium ganghwense]